MQNSPGVVKAALCFEIFEKKPLLIQGHPPGGMSLREHVAEKSGVVLVARWGPGVFAAAKRMNERE